MICFQLSSTYAIYVSGLIWYVQACSEYDQFFKSTLAIEYQVDITNFSTVSF
jgi:hypothetical protein